MTSVRHVIDNDQEADGYSPVEHFPRRLRCYLRVPEN